MAWFSSQLGVFVMPTQLKRVSSHEAGIQEELEDKAHGNAADQAGEIQRSPEELAAPDLEAEDGGEQQRQGNLDHGAHHVIKAQLQCLEAVGAAEDVYVVPQAHEAPDPEIVPVVEAELDHLEEGQVGKGEEQQQGDEEEHDGADHLLAPHSPAFLREGEFRSIQCGMRLAHGVPSLF